MNVVGPAGNIIQQNSDLSQESEIALYSRLEANFTAGLLTSDNSSSTDLSLDENENDSISAGFRSSSGLHISNKPQLAIAPDLSDLKKNQDLHNRLQTTSQGLSAIQQNLETLAATVSSGSSDTSSDTVNKIITRINKTIDETSYNDQAVFIREKNTGAAVPLSVQEAIITSKANVNQDGDGNYLTKGTEIFMLANNNKATLYSFPQNTPLEEINNKIADYSADIGIHPLIYVESRQNGQPEVVNSNASGTAGNKSNLTLTPIDGELFSRSIYSPNANNERISASVLSVKIVNDNNNISLSENISKDSISGTINLAEDTVQGSFDTDKMRRSNHSLTRSVEFSERLGKDIREGDGFAVTPQTEKEPVPRSVIERQMQEEITAVESNKDNPGTNTTGRSGILIMPDRQLTTPPPPAPYVTLQEREYGITGEESLYQTDKIFLAAAEPKNTAADSKTAQDVTDEKNSARNAIEPVSPVDETGSAFTEYNSNSSENNNTGESDNSQNNDGDRSEKLSTRLRSMTDAAVNTAGENYHELRISAPSNPVNSQTDTSVRPAEQTAATEENSNSADNTQENTTAGREVAELAGKENTEQQSTDRETEAALEDNTGNKISTTSKIASSPASSASSIIKSIDGVIQNTLNFTITGDKGSIDFVISAGNTNETVAIAINSTQNFTGVTATNTRNSITLQGESGNQFKEFPTDNQLIQSAEEFRNSQIEQSTASNQPAQKSAQTADRQTELTVNLSDLGLTERNGNTYSLNSLPELLTDLNSSQTEENLQTGIDIINNALAEISALQSNLQSLTSLNERNVDYVSQQINEKLLPDSVEPLTRNSRPADIEQALNLVAVGISNSISASGGVGIGNDPLASLHLLSTTPAITSNRAEPSQLQNLHNMEENPAAFNMASMQALSSYNLNDYEITRNQQTIAGLKQTDQTDNFAPVYTQLSEDLAAGRAILEQIQETISNGADNFAVHIDSLNQAADDFFSRIENARLTIRELGRAYEAEDSINTLQKERFAERAYNIASYNKKREETVAEEATFLNSAEQLRLDSQQFSRTDFHEMLENIGHALGNRPIDYSFTNTLNTLAFRENTNSFKAPASAAFSGATDSKPVVTTSAAKTNNFTTLNREDDYKSLSKIINGRLGNITVHGQDYTMSDLTANNWQLTTDNSTNTQITTSVLEKALEEITVAENISNEMTAGELLDKGTDISGAIDSYGSELSATTPSVAYHAAQIKSLSRE